MTLFVPETIAEFEPRLKLSDKDLPGLDVKEGRKVRMILNYKVIEKTKSFTVLRITGAYLFPTARIL